MAKIDSLFKMMKQQGASDLHISTGAPPLFRLHGEMEKLNYPPLSDQQARGLLFEILNKEQRAEFEENLDLDFAYSLAGCCTFPWQSSGDPPGCCRCLPDYPEQNSDCRPAWSCRKVSVS